MFWVGFTQEPLAAAEAGEEGRVGLLRLGVYEERFVSHFYNWSEQDYSEHWIRALVRVLDGRPSALITDMWLPSQAGFLTWWPMWRDGEEVILHNQLLFFEKFGLTDADAKMEMLFSLAGPRVSRNFEGTPISEWCVPIQAIEEFLKKTASTL